MLFYPKMIYILANDQDKTKKPHNNDVYDLNKTNQKVTCHKKIKIRVIKSQRKQIKRKKKKIFKFSKNLIWQMPLLRPCVISLFKASRGMHHCPK